MVQVTSLFKSGGTKQLKAKTTAKPPAKKTSTIGLRKWGCCKRLHAAHPVLRITTALSIQAASIATHTNYTSTYTQSSVIFSPSKPRSHKIITPTVAPAKPATKKVTVAPRKPGTQKSAGFRKYDGDALWLPNTTRPEWLTGELPGDRGFDPLGLARPVSYLQYDLDGNDQNLAVNKKGGIVGQFNPTVDQVSEDRLQPYSEVFGLQRFRECELIHGRWAMLAALGALVGEASTGITWWEAGKVELDGARYLDFALPFSVSQLTVIEVCATATSTSLWNVYPLTRLSTRLCAQVLLVGGAELYRNGELEPEKRCYPGGVFDPLNLATSEDPDRVFKLKEAELKHGRLAMVAFLGYAVQAGVTREGALGSLAKFANSF